MTNDTLVNTALVTTPPEAKVCIYSAATRGSNSTTKRKRRSHINLLEFKEIRKPFPFVGIQFLSLHEVRYIFPRRNNYHRTLPKKTLEADEIGKRRRENRNRLQIKEGFPVQRTRSQNTTMKDVRASCECAMR